ncbi:hypothetical protein ScPMuIL_006711 [Solemya velum]
MVFIFELVFLSVVQTALGGDWSYEGSNGPGNWTATYPKCGGSSQSPIDIPQEKDLVFDKSLGSISFHGYDNRSVQVTLTNSGHSAKGVLDGDMWIEGGGLTSKYYAAQFHYHWGSDVTNGSEHTVNGKAYPLELHIVHYRAEYGSLTNAVNKSDGLAVIGFFADVGLNDNVNMSQITDVLGGSVQNKSDTYVLGNVSMADFLPESYGNFYRYSGSLTTPSCDESVTWSVFTDRFSISNGQTTNTITENTRKNNIVAMYPANKLCKTSETQRSNGENVKCPNHQEHCSANLEQWGSIGESHYDVYFASRCWPRELFTHGWRILNITNCAIRTMVFIFELFFLSVVQTALGGDWSYEGSNGPGNWTATFPKCGGSSQSPIDIPHEKDLVFDKSLGSISFHGYDNTSVQVTLTNNGHSAKGVLDGDMWIEGGGLTSKYYAAQFHYHWGSDVTNGSEHTVNGKAYPLELHIVHYRAEYGSLTNAINKSDGLAVLGFFADVGLNDNVNMSQITDVLGGSVQNKSDTYVLGNVSMADFLPESYGNFYRYSGSLTTPSCDESVTWSVFTDRFSISNGQLAKFRSLYVNSSSDGNAAHIEDNFRPIQPLNSRKVKTNFQINTSGVSINNMALANMFFLFLGPGNWTATYPKCGGSSQSPIDIPQEKDLVFDKSLGSISFHGYDNTSVQVTLTNNGHSAKGVLDGDMWIEGGGLTSKYYAAQFHYHWGSDVTNGSEHTVNGKAYPLELHIVHYRAEYGSLTNAINKSDGLAVLGFFADVGLNDNVNMSQITDVLGGSVQNKSDTYVLGNVSMADFLPESYGNFYRYSGSLTTPSCDESVTWSVFTDRFNISNGQLAKFRSLYVNSSSDGNAAHIEDNFRPIQPLNSRKVKTNFQINTSGVSINNMALANMFVFVVFCLVFDTVKVNIDMQVEADICDLIFLQW